MFTCTCCEEPKSYKSVKALYVHQRNYDKSFIEPADRLRHYYELNPKTCSGCQQKLVFAKRHHKFCSQSCAAITNNKLFPKRGVLRLIEPQKEKKVRVVLQKTLCLLCGTQNFSGRRKYCSLACSAAHRRATHLEKLLRGEIARSTNKTWKRYLIERDGAKCSSCHLDTWLGQPINLEVDHVDGNAENEEEKNLRLICPNCHSYTSTYKNRNAGKGRHWRRQRYADGKSY